MPDEDRLLFLARIVEDEARLPGVARDVDLNEAAAALRRLGRLERVLGEVGKDWVSLQVNWIPFHNTFSAWIGPKDGRGDTPLAALLALAEALALD